jgi:hypothetical protein
MGAKCGIASAYPSEAHEFTPGLQLGACCWIFSFYDGTSMLTIQLEAEDNQAVIKCEVEQELATLDMYIQSQPDNLVVYCR